MPGIDGMEVLKRVKETDPQLPVVLITAYAEIPGSVAAMKAGAFDYLAKPFDHTEVMRVVRAALSERQRRRQATVEEIPADNCLRVMMGPSDARYPDHPRGEPGVPIGLQCHHPGGNRRRQRAGGPGHPPIEPSGRGPLYSPGLWGYSRNPHRKRTLRLPEGRLHRRHGAQDWENSRPPRAAPYSWTRLPICRLRPKRGCCGSSRRRRSCAWEPSGPSRSTSACSPPVIKCSWDWWSRARCGRISTSG